MKFIEIRSPFSVWIAGSTAQCISAAATGLVDAVVTNPTVVASWCAGGTTLQAAALEVVSATNLPLFIQLKGPSSEAMLEEAEKLLLISPLICPKLPSTLEGLRATAVLSARGVVTLTTTICTARQAAMFAAAGAPYLCPYYSRLEEAGGSPEQLIRDTARQFRERACQTKILPASIRSVDQIENTFLAGGAGVIVFADLFEQMLRHRVTETSLARFAAEDWPRINF